MVILGIIGGSGAQDVIKALGHGTDVRHAKVTGEQEIHLEQFRAGDIVSRVPGKALSPRGFCARVDYYHFIHGETEVYFVLRHGIDHADLPAKLDQRGIFHFLKCKNVDAVVLTSATGSLDTKVKLVDEGGMVVNSGFLRGLGYRGISYNNPARPHAVMATPYHDDIRRLLLDSIHSIENAKEYDGGLYIHNEGNQFESPAEIADLVCRLDAPKLHLEHLRARKRAPRDEMQLYIRLAKNLSREQAQVGMTAGRETVLAGEAGLKVGLVSFPVNYGAGLLPDEKVDHERTMRAISTATQPYIVPFLRTVIEKAPQYL